MGCVHNLAVIVTDFKELCKTTGGGKIYQTPISPSLHQHRILLCVLWGGTTDLADGSVPSWEGFHSILKLVWGIFFLFNLIGVQVQCWLSSWCCGSFCFLSQRQWFAVTVFCSTPCCMFVFQSQSTQVCGTSQVGRHGAEEPCYSLPKLMQWTWSKNWVFEFAEPQAVLSSPVSCGIAWL